MKKIIISGLMLSCCLPSFAQLTIEECYRKAQANYPLVRQYDLIEKAAEYNLSNVGKGYLPQVMFSAKATRQSDVTQLPIDLSRLGIEGLSMPVVKKEQYGATVEVTQTVWDGGTIRAQKEGVRTAAEIEKRANDVDMYSINERVNQLFFGILLTDARIRLNRLLLDDLRRNYESVESYMRNGIANQTDLDAIRVSLLKAEQEATLFENGKNAYIAMLSAFIGEELAADTEFVKPEALRPATGIINRPELGVFDAQIRNLETKEREINAGVMPKLGIFVTGGYGRPGLNMLEHDFSAYYIVGAKITWNFGNLYTRKNSRNLIRNNIRSVETQRDAFLFNAGLDIVQKNNTIDTYIDLLRYDDEIIGLRNSVRRAAEVRMANGTISGSDLTREIIAEQMAMQDRVLHETELLLAIYNLKFATNN